MKPFLKWAGGKHRLLERIVPLLPSGGRLIEPFAGSGAVFLNTQYVRYLLADANADLIHLYLQVQQDGADFIAYCAQFFTYQMNDKAAYYALRARFNASRCLRERAALFLYLNRHGYNGLCRYNASGGFNVPFGRYARPYFPRAEMLHFHAKSSSAMFVHADFRAVMQRAAAGDVVYCDPPYVPLSSTAHFTSYAAGGFSEADQWELAELARSLRARGVTVVISNHDTPLIREAYDGAKILPFKVRRTISCDGTNRSYAPELLAVFA